MARILAIDDDAEALLLTEASLRGAGHEVSTCRDASQVAALTAANPYDALVLDLDMPEISGLEVLRSLRRAVRTRGLPVLVLSNLAESADRVRGLREGADDYLAKPYDPDELVLRLERLVAAPRTRGALAGDLETYSVWELLQSLARSGRSGTVLMVAGERSAELYLVAGRLIEARIGALTGEEAMVAALDFVEGSFRFFEGDLLGGDGGSAWEGFDAASVVLRHAWLLDEARRAATLRLGPDEPCAFVDPGGLELPPRLETPAVLDLLARLRAAPRFTRGSLVALEIAAPLTVEALLAHLAARGALRSAATAEEGAADR